MSESVGLSGGYIEKLLNSLPLNNFRGVYSIDTIPQLIPETSLIFNLSHAWERGSHFVALYLSHTHLYFFDSFGTISYLYHPTLQIKLHTLTQYYDVIFELVIREPIQPLDSYFCGYYCIYFIMLYDSAKPFKFRSKTFQALQSRENDDIVIKNITTWINVSRRFIRYNEYN